MTGSRSFVICALLIMISSDKVGDALPSSCKTIAKRVASMNPFKTSTKGDIYCPLRNEPIAMLEREFENLAGQENALVRASCAELPSRAAAR